MNKTFLTVLSIVFALTACQKNEKYILSSEGSVLSAAIEEVSATKTYMDDDNNIRWSEGDQVLAFMQSSLGIKYQVLSDYVGKTLGKFSKVSTDYSDDLYAGFELDHNVVYYPYSDDVCIEKSGDNYTLNVILPTEQAYSENSFGNGAMPMLAVSEDNDVIFKNVCGGIKFQIKGNKKITAIKLEGKNNESLSGAAILTAYTDGTKPSIEMSSDAAASVTLDCGVGVQLAEDNITEFIIVLPPVVFKNGFTVSVTDSESNTYTIESNRTNSVRRSSLLVMPVITLGDSGLEYPEDDEPVTVQGHNPEPYFSEMVEMMGMIWRLAGASEYNQCNVGSVTSSADIHFASLKTHKAVNLAMQYRQQDISYDAVTGFANQLVFNQNGDIIFDPDYLEGSNSSFDERWTNQQKNDMLAAVNDFYWKSNFHEWFVSTRVEQQQAIASFKSVCNLDYTWFDSFYGKNDKLASRIILSFMIGSGNNGISLQRQDGTLLLTPVIGSLGVSSEGVFFYGDMNLIVHEFSHPYCNPLIEANWSSISAKSEEVYKGVESIMQSQAYSNARTMMCETLVRASAIRYMMSHGQMNYVGSCISQEERNGFVMIRCLIKALGKRENESDKYASLADFMPQIIDAINNFDPNASYDLEDAPQPDTLPHDYVDLGIEMSDGRKLYFATRNVGETSPGGIGSSAYCWGALVNLGSGWIPTESSSFEGWPEGHRLDEEHDIAAIKWGGDWHIPSPEEWEALVENCDFERKGAEESGYGVTGYFFYSKSDRSKFIFIPVAYWSNQLQYWSSEIMGTGGNVNYVRYFTSNYDKVGCFGGASVENRGFAVRPVIAAEGSFEANGHDYVDLDIKMNNGKKLYFATMNVGETSPAGYESYTYCWGATTEGCFPWVPESYYNDKWLDAAHDVATQTWGEKWHVPSPEEWRLLVENCDYERKEAYESEYGVAGYFFYNKSDRKKYIFLPVEPLTNELRYWSSLMSGSSDAYVLISQRGHVNYSSYAGVARTEYAIRPVFVE